MNKEEKKTTKLKLKWQFKLLLIIIFIILYSFFIGTKGIQTKEYQIQTNKIDKKTNGIKILQFSDLHYGSSVNQKDIKKLVNKINDTKPDIVIFTGDLIDERYEITEIEKENLTKQLSKINAELGKYYITGEEDNNDCLSILNLSNFINIDDHFKMIYKESLTPIILGGKNAMLEYNKKQKEDNFFEILALHNPSHLKKLKKYNFDITIAGHTHNGQINIPKIKELLINSKYINSYEKLDNTKLFINPGIGTSKINARLFNKPTIYLYRINQTKK